MPAPLSSYFTPKIWDFVSITMILPSRWFHHVNYVTMSEHEHSNEGSSLSTAHLDSFWWKPDHLQPLLCVRIAIEYMSIYQIYNTSFVHQLFAKHLHQFCLQRTNGYEGATILHWFCQQDKSHFNAVHRAGLYDKFKFMYPNLLKNHAMTSDRHVGLHSFPIFLMTNKQT